MNFRQRVNPFTVNGLLEVLGRNTLRACVTVLACVLVSLIFFYRTSATYISEVSLLVPSSYIALLTRDEGVPMVPDAELGSFRIALVRSVLSDSFLDGLGERYDIFQESLDAPKHSIERQAFRSRFILEALPASTIRISVTGNSPEQVSGLLSDIVKEMRKVLLRRIKGESDMNEESIVSVIKEPVVPEAPLTPHKRDYLLVGIFLGLLASLCQIAYHEYRLSQFLFPEEVAAALGVEFMGDLPEIPRVQWLYLLDHVKTSRQKLIG